LSTQCNNLTNYQLGNTPRVRKGTIEHGNTTLSSVFQVDLVSPDAKTSDADKVLGVFQNVFCQFGFGADADGLDVLDLLDQFLFPEGSFVEFNLPTLHSDIMGSRT
jgi:hypothetical protein